MNSVESCEQKDTSRNCNLLHCPSNLVKKTERDLSNESQKPNGRDKFIYFLFFSSFFHFFFILWLLASCFIQKKNHFKQLTTFFRPHFPLFLPIFLFSRCFPNGLSTVYVTGEINLVTTFPRISLNRKRLEECSIRIL